MFHPANIILIKDFDFERSGTATRDKYMIVILKIGSDAIIAPLTTSKDYIPEEHKGPRCVIHSPSRLHCYCIPQALVVGKRGFSFHKDTYIQVQSNLTTRSISSLRSKYELTGMAELKDELTDSEYSDLLYCIYKSEFVTRRVRRLIEPIVERIERERANQSK